MTDTGALQNTGFRQTSGEIRELTEREVLVQAVNLASTSEELVEAEARLRLYEIRIELREERISYGELVELESLREYIDEDDIELLQAIDPEQE